jgi:spore germination cell wall hydrolase CwlJ-like protein
VRFSIGGKMTRHILQTLPDVKLLALLLWHEARGESVLGRLAVAHVAINRVGKQSWYGRDIREVVTKPYQFSCFNDDNFAIHYDEVCMTVAELALGGATVDVSQGATHYHADYVSPTWAADMVHLVTIGRHLFYKAVGE